METLTGELLEERGGGFPGDERDENDFSAGGLDRAAFLLVERFEGVITAFDIDVGLGGSKEPGGADIGEDGDGIDRFQGGEDGGAVVLGIDGAALAFQAADGGIAVDADEEKVTEIAGGLEVGDVAEVEEIEAAVGDDEIFGAAELGAPAGKIGEFDEFGEEVQRVQDWFVFCPEDLSHRK